MESTERQFVKLREYARIIGCDMVIIHRAIRDGKIPADAVKVNEKNGRPVIDLAKAEEAWGNNYRVTRRVNRKDRHAAHVPAEDHIPAPPEGTSIPGRLPMLPMDHADMDYKTADRLEKIADMRIKQLKAAELEGQLVRTDAIERVFFDFARSVRNGMQNIADRVIDQVLSAPSRNEAHILLQAEIDRVLDSLSTMPEYRAQ